MLKLVIYYCNVLALGYYVVSKKRKNSIHLLAFCLINLCYIIFDDLLDYQFDVLCVV